MLYEGRRCIANVVSSSMVNVLNLSVIYEIFRRNHLCYSNGLRIIVVLIKTNNPKEGDTQRHVYYNILGLLFLPLLTFLSKDKIYVFSAENYREENK